MWDKDAALTRLMDNTDLLKQICRIFVDTSPAQMALLSQHIDANDLEKIQTQSHTLKGSTGVIGATELHRLLTEIEVQAKRRNIAEIPELFAQLQTSYDNFKTLLVDYLA